MRIDGLDPLVAVGSANQLIGTVPARQVVTSLASAFLIGSDAPGTFRR